MDLKLRRTPGVYLVGFMGAGKSTIGRRLAQELGWTFADLDDDIEKSQQRTISSLFDTDGEEVFRRIEAEALALRVGRIRAGTATVLALGGGAFARESNRETIRNSGVSIWLDCPFDILWERVGRASHRPLARDQRQFEELYRTRQAVYALADYRIEASDENPTAAIESILELPPFR